MFKLDNKRNTHTKIDTQNRLKLKLKCLHFFLITNKKMIKTLTS